MVGNDRSANLAEAMIAFRRNRGRILTPDIFGEPAWDLLLELFVADARGLRLTGRDVCKRTNVAASTMSRWLLLLVKHGLVIGDGTGDLTDELSLSGDGMARMEQALSSATDLQAALELA